MRAEHSQELFNRLSSNNFTPTPIIILYAQYMQSLPLPATLSVAQADAFCQCSVSFRFVGFERFRYYLEMIPRRLERRRYIIAVNL
jgi:hypothetical protein